MWPPLLDRFRHWLSGLRGVAWRFFIAGPSTAGGSLALLRGEFLPADAARKLKVLALLAKARNFHNETIEELAKELQLARRQRERELDPMPRALRKALDR